MKKLITFLIALLLMIIWASCNTESGNRPRNMQVIFDAVRVQYDTAYFNMLNDTVAYNKFKHTYLRRRIFINAAGEKRDVFVEVN